MTPIIWRGDAAEYAISESKDDFVTETTHYS
jgi:hypothetical protein